MADILEFPAPKVVIDDLFEMGEIFYVTPSKMFPDRWLVVRREVMSDHETEEAAHKTACAFNLLEDQDLL